MTTIDRLKERIYEVVYYSPDMDKILSLQDILRAIELNMEDTQWCELSTSVN